MSAPSTSKNGKPKVEPLPRGTATAADVQRHALAKLLADPSKPVHIPAPPREGVKQLRAPRETMKNVQGSSAGAGSGEFHVYKQSRRREYERLQLMDEEEALTKEKQAALDRQAENLAKEEEKTAKNRLKRQRKKANRKGGKAKDGDESDDDKDQPAAEWTGEKKRKLGGAPGVQFAFKAAGDGDDDEDAEERELRKDTVDDEVVALAQQQQQEVKAAQEAGIKIQDDDW
ncbi:DUF1168 domain protein [Pseudohyphozyma bogoriensis]|nr:DUF1168 domain protein [Pseudohyphozyma bogoriensis]